MPDMWETLKDQIISVVTSRTKDFLDSNVGVKALLMERAERMAKLTENYLTSSDADMKARIADSMQDVRQTIENEIDAAAANASVAAKGVFKQVVGVAFDMLIKALPVIAGVI